MNNYIVFSKLEVLNEEIVHVGQRFEANNLHEASAFVRKLVRFEKVKEFLIVCYEDWSRDPDIGKMRIGAKDNYNRRISIRVKQDGWHY